MAAYDFRCSHVCLQNAVQYPVLVDFHHKDVTTWKKLSTECTCMSLTFKSANLLAIHFMKPYSLIQ